MPQFFTDADFVGAASVFDAIWGWELEEADDDERAALALLYTAGAVAGANWVRVIRSEAEGEVLALLCAAIKPEATPESAASQHDGSRYAALALHYREALSQSAVGRRILDFYAQIDAVNAVFADYELSTDDTLGHFAVNGFFTSTYDDVRELNLKEFLTYFGECGEEDISEEEFAQLKDKWADFKAERLEDFPLPIHRYPASAVEAVLQRFAGIGLADLKDIQEPFSGYTYLESTDAFYNTTSDYAPGYFICTGGEVNLEEE